MSCLAPYDGNEVFIQRNYEHNGWTNYLHNHAPRFGYTTNVIDWYQGTEEEQNSYVRGLHSNVIAMSFLFVMWIAALIFFKIRGPSYFGWLSGRRNHIPPEPTPEGVPQSEDEMLLLDQEKEFITVDSIKAKNQKLGLSLGKTREGAIVIYNIDQKGLFFGSDLQVGHRIAAVNDQRCTSDLKETIQMLQECEGTFTIKVHDEICEEDLAVVEWDTVLAKTQREQKMFRHIIFFALVVIISMGIVLSTDGVQPLSRVVNQGVKSFDKIEEFAQFGLDLLNSMEKSISNIKKDGHYLLEAVNEVCPKQADKICSDIKDPSSCREDLGLPFVGELKLAISYINYEAGFQQKINEAREELEFLISHTFGLSAGLKQLNSLLWAIMVMSIALSITCVVIVAGIGFQVPQIVGFLRRSCVYPLFIIMILFSFALGVSFLMISLVAADTCHGDPGPKIAAMVESSYPGGSSEMMDDIMLRIFEGCQAPSLPLKANIDRLRDDILFFEQFSSNLETFEPHRVKHCGASPWTFSKLDLAINNKVNEHLCTASEDLVEFGDFFSCRFWYPMYFKAVHESMCTDGTEGLAVVATTQIIVVFMALVLMTYRVALLGIEVSTAPKSSTKMVDIKGGEPPKSAGTLLTITSRLTDDSGSDGDLDSSGSPSTPIIIAIEDIEPPCQEVQPLVMPAVDYPPTDESCSVSKEGQIEGNPLLVSRTVVLDENESQRSIMVTENAKEAPSTITPMIGMTVLESIELDHDGNSSVSSINPPVRQRQTSTNSELSDISNDNDNDSINWKDLVKPGHVVTEDRMLSIDEEAVVSDTDIQYAPATEKDNVSVELSLDGSRTSLHSLNSIGTKPAPFSGIKVSSTRSLLSYGEVEKRKRQTLEKNDSRRSIHSAPSVLERKSNGPQAEDCNESVTPILVETKAAAGFLTRGSSVTLLIPENTEDESHSRDCSSVTSSTKQGIALQPCSATLSVDLSDSGAQDVEAGILPAQSLRAPQPPIDTDDYDMAQDESHEPVDMDDNCTDKTDDRPQPLYYDMTLDAASEEVATDSTPQILALEKVSQPKEVATISPSQILVLERGSTTNHSRSQSVPMTRSITSVYSSIETTIADAEALMKEKKDRPKLVHRDESFSNQSAPAAPLSRPGAVQKQVSLTLSEGGSGDIEVQNFLSS